MNYIFTFILAICVPFSVFAQESVTEIKKMAFENPYNPANQNLINMLNHEDNSSRRNLMLFDTWQSMDAEGLDGTRLHVDSANYHIATEKMFFLYQGKMFELFPEKIDQVKLGERTFVKHPIKVDGNRSRFQYFELLVRGEYNLLARFEIKTRVTNTNPMGLPGTNEEEYIRDENWYYLRTGARFPEPVPTRKSDFILIFRKNRSQMASFAKEKRISLRSREDVEAAFTYYNELAQINN